MIKDAKKLNLSYFEIENLYPSAKKITSIALNITKDRSKSNLAN